MEGECMYAMWETIKICSAEDHPNFHIAAKTNNRYSTEEKEMPEMP